MSVVWGKSYYKSLKSENFSPEKIIDEEIESEQEAQILVSPKNPGRPKKQVVWTPEEDAILLKSAEEKKSLIEVYPLLKEKSLSACRTRMRELNCTPQRLSWTDEDVEIISKYYPYIGKYVSRLLPNHSENSCKWYASKHGLFFNSLSSKRWTQEEIDILKKYFSSEGCETVKRLKGRTYRDCFIKAVCQLQLSVPSNGYESLLQFPLEENGWSTEEDAVLLDNIYNLKEAARLSHRTVRECAARLDYLGVYMYDERWNTEWSKEECDVLKEHYSRYGTAICELLPGRSPSAIRTKANRLGLVFTWSAEELECLRQYYPIMGEQVSLLLPEKSLPAILAQARFYKLKYHGPTDEGREGQSPE